MFIDTYFNNNHCRGKKYRKIFKVALMNIKEIILKVVAGEFISEIQYLCNFVMKLNYNEKNIVLTLCRVKIKERAKKHCGKLCK